MASPAAHSSATTLIPMLPDASVWWVQHELPNNVGQIVVPLDVHERALHILTSYAGGVWNERQSPAARRGKCGMVDFVGDLAVKIFSPYSSKLTSGLEALRHNAALSYAFKRAGAVIDGEWEVDAPEQLGAFFPADKSRPPMWVMSKIRGRQAGFGLNRWHDGNSTLTGMLPERKERERVFAAAVRLCGVDPRSIDWDDSDGSGNLMVARGTGRAPLRLIKFDVQGVRHE